MARCITALNSALRGTVDTVRNTLNASTLRINRNSESSPTYIHINIRRRRDHAVVVLRQPQGSYMEMVPCLNIQPRDGSGKQYNFQKRKVF